MIFLILRNIELIIKLNFIYDKSCMCSFKLDISSISFKSIGWLTSAFNCPANMELTRVGTIFSEEVMWHFRVIHWLCGFTRYY